MESTDRTLVGLCLILKEFGITVGKPLTTKVDSIDMDMISSSIALLQTIHPMGYKFEVELLAGRHKIKSNKLAREIETLQKRTNRGDLILLERQMRLKEEVSAKIDIVRKECKPPKEWPYRPSAWLFFLGFYSVISNQYQAGLLEIFLRDYGDFLPYLDLAEETLRNLAFNYGGNV